MYQKILVPLDKSKEAERVLPLVRKLLIPESEVILLHVMPPGRTIWMEGMVWPAAQQEEVGRYSAMSYLQGLASRIDKGSNSWRCEVIVQRSVVDGITDYADKEQVELIAMYTHDRKGLAKLIKGSIAEKVWLKASIEVQVIKPQELVAV